MVAGERMKITTVRITPEQHAWVSQNRPQQLSSIVRAHLEELIHQQTPVNFHNAWREGAQKCYPFMRGGYCGLCWPVGVPTRAAWQEYIQEFGTHGLREGDRLRQRLTFEEWSMQQHHSRQATLDDWNRDSESYQVANQESSQALPGQPGLIRRILRRFFG